MSQSELSPISPKTGESPLVNAAESKPPKEAKKRIPTSLNPCKLTNIANALVRRTTRYDENLQRSDSKLDCDSNFLVRN